MFCISEWVADVEAEGRVIEAIIHVLKKTGINVTNLLETIKLAENRDVSQLCLDTNGFNIHTASRNSMDNDLKVICILIVLKTTCIETQNWNNVTIF